MQRAEMHFFGMQSLVRLLLKKYYHASQRLQEPLPAGSFHPRKKEGRL
jgi:hypothetical protein